MMVGAEEEMRLTVEELCKKCPPSGEREAVSEIPLHDDEASEDGLSVIRIVTTVRWWTSINTSATHASGYETLLVATHRFETAALAHKDSKGGFMTPDKTLRSFDFCMRCIGEGSVIYGTPVTDATSITRATYTDGRLGISLGMVAPSLSASLGIRHVVQVRTPAVRVVELGEWTEGIARWRYTFDTSDPGVHDGGHHTAEEAMIFRTEGPTLALNLTQAVRGRFAGGVTSVPPHQWGIHVPAANIDPAEFTLGLIGFGATNAGKTEFLNTFIRVCGGERVFGGSIQRLLAGPTVHTSMVITAREILTMPRHSTFRYRLRAIDIGGRFYDVDHAYDRALIDRLLAGLPEGTDLALESSWRTAEIDARNRINIPVVVADATRLVKPQGFWKSLFGWGYETGESELSALLKLYQYVTTKVSDPDTMQPLFVLTKLDQLHAAGQAFLLEELRRIQEKEQVWIANNNLIPVRKQCLERLDQQRLARADPNLKMEPICTEYRCRHDFTQDTYAAVEHVRDQWNGYTISQPA